MWFLVMTLQDGIAVVALLVWGDEIGVYLFLCLADFDTKGWYLLESTGFYADTVKLALFHLNYKIWIKQYNTDCECWGKINTSTLTFLSIFYINIYWNKKSLDYPIIFLNSTQIFYESDQLRQPQRCSAHAKAHLLRLIRTAILTRKDLLKQWTSLKTQNHKFKN